MKTVQELDAALQSDIKMQPTWDVDHWHWDDWYTFLEITPEYLIQKCRDKGLDVDDTIRAWGNMLHNVRRSRNPKPEENFGTKVWDAEAKKTHELKYHKNISPEQLEPIVNFKATVDKEAERQGYQSCTLRAPPEDLDHTERTMCQGTVICRPPKDGIDRTVRSDEDYDTIEASALSETEKIKYRRCRSLGETCQDTAIYEVYDKDNFHYIPNGGIGDCLFIAVHHYIVLAEAIGEALDTTPIYPAPGTNELYEGMELKLVPKTYLELVAGAAKLRAAVCDYYASNPGASFLAGRKLREELAILNLDGGIYSRMALVQQFNAYVDSLGENNPLALQHGGIARAKTVIENSQGKAMESARQHLIEAMYQNYITQMRKRTTYGGNAEIVALSKILKKNVKILQRAEDGHYVANMGFVVDNKGDTLYIYHNTSVNGVGSLHFEIMFPLGDGFFEEEEVEEVEEIEEVEEVEELQEPVEDNTDAKRDAFLELLQETRFSEALKNPGAAEAFLASGLLNTNSSFVSSFNKILLPQILKDPKNYPIYDALVPSPADEYDVITSVVTPDPTGRDARETVRAYDALFDVLDIADKGKLLTQCAADTIADCTEYDPEGTPGYNVNGENRLLFYTMRMPAVRDIDYTYDIGTATEPLLTCMVKVRKLLSEDITLDEDETAVYRAAIGLDDEEDPDYDDETEYTLQTTLFRKALKTIERSPTALSAIDTLRRSIIYIHCGATGIIMLQDKAYKPFIPDKENTTIERLMDVMDVLNEYLTIV